MTEPTTAVITEIRDPKLRVVARNFRSMLELALHRVAAHHAAPGAITLPTSGIEAALAARFRTLPADRQRRAADRATGLLAGAGDRTARFGPAGAASLRSNLPIAAQVRDRMVPRELGLTAAYLEAADAASDAAGFRPLTTLGKLGLRLHEVRCVDETDLEWPGSDTIVLGGVAISATGATTSVPSMKISSSFDDGDRKRFSPPLRLASFDLTAGTAWPKTYFFTLVIAEQDHGGFPAFLKELYEGLKSEIVSALAGVIGGVIGATGGPIGAAVGAVLGWAVGELYTLLKTLWEDDEFPPATLSVKFPSLGMRWANGATDSPEGKVIFKGHGGTYEVTFDWQLFT